MKKVVYLHCNPLWVTPDNNIKDNNLKEIINNKNTTIMTKKVLFALAFAALMLPASLRAQEEVPDTLWMEDFRDSAAWASSWTVEPYISDSTLNWYDMEGYYGIIMNGATGAMTSPEIVIPEDTGYSLVVDLSGLSQYAATYDLRGGYSVEIYDVNDLESENTILDEDFTDLGGENVHKAISLAAWAGKTVKIVFRFANDEYQTSLFAVFKVAIRTTNKPYYEISAPSTAFIGQTYELTANHIEGDETTVEFEWTSVIGTIGNTSAENTVITYENSGIDTITLTVTNEYGDFTTKTLVRAISWSDIVSGCETPVDGYPYVQDFEDENNFDCLKRFDADGDGNNWSIVDTTGGRKVHSGVRCATSASYSNQSSRPLTPDNWLFMPPFVLPEDVTDFTLSWWAVAQDPNWTHENYSVYVTEDPETFGTNPVYTGEPTGTYAQQSISLEEYAGKTIYVAFRHHDCTDNFMLNIDDIVVGNIVGINSVENAANVTIFPNPVCNVLNVEGENVKSVEVIDINGRVVLTNDRAGKLDMSEVADGVYMVRVMSLSGVTTQKIVKK